MSDPLTQEMKPTGVNTQFMDKVHIPNKSPCLRPGIRSVSGSNRNKAITFSTNSWAKRREHWCEWRPHKMCIARCLRCGLGWAQGEGRGATSTADLWARVHLCMQTKASRLPALCLCWSPSTFEHRLPKINKSAQGHQRRKRRARFQAARRETSL